MRVSKHKSAKDVIFKLIIFTASCLFLTLSIVLLILIVLNKFHDVFVVVFLLVFGTIGLLIWYGLNYSIRDKYLDIAVFNLIVYSINISQIKSISKKRSGTYIYGLSNDTISLIVRNKEINISPFEKGELIIELMLINPNIILEDG